MGDEATPGVKIEETRTLSTGTDGDATEAEPKEGEEEQPAADDGDEKPEDETTDED